MAASVSPPDELTYSVFGDPLTPVAFPDHHDVPPNE